MGRYYRLCTRWNRVFTVSEQRIQQLTCETLPSVVETEMLRDDRKLDWKKFWKRAKKQEGWLKRNNNNKLPEPTEPFKVFTADSQENKNNETNRQGNENTRKWKGNQQRKPYKCCGLMNHFTKDCQLASSKCHKCQVIGHISKVCPNIVVKDDKGRVSMLVKPTPSKNVLEQRKDRTKS